MKHPNVVVVLSTREKVATFRAGLGDALGLIALGPETESFWKMAGIDAFYLSLTRAARWGSRPIPVHTAAVLRTSQTDQQEGFPPFIITGLVLEEDEANTAEVCVPLIVKALFRAIDEVNSQDASTIRTIGFFEFELTFPGSSLDEVARLLARSFAKFASSDTR